MLTTLRIKNLALVAELTLELQPGYNVITGETGAGKSILIGALGLVLGERADRTLIRAGSDACVVEAVFDISKLERPLALFLQENGLEPCDQSQLVLKRSFSNSGTNRQFVNGSPTSLNALAGIGEALVDIHGPHDHQSLLNPGRQLAILDAFGGLEGHRDEFARLVDRRDELNREKIALVVDEKTYAQQLDLLRFQVNEIAAARIQAGEETALDQEHMRASNSARLLQLGQTALDFLGENETSLLTEAGVVGRALQELRRLDPGAASLQDLHEQIVLLLRELQSELSRYLEKADVDPARLQALEERLNLINLLKRKYGNSLEEVLRFGDDAERKLRTLESRDAELARINAELKKVEIELLSSGQELSAKRKEVSPRLCKAVVKQLADLGFKQSRFDLALTSRQFEGIQDNVAVSSGVAKPQSLSRHGFDNVEFQFAPNPGEPARALRAIASSGELARVMLALKTVLAAEDQIPVLVFDEVDANIGGETAVAVGQKMRQIAGKRQVICITHLPQVAAPASAHFIASKQTKDGRTVSEIFRIDDQQRITELARMLGGQSDAARKHAKTLLKLDASSTA
jgi:DNA repair protein RecN (Recombination protein N)